MNLCSTPVIVVLLQAQSTWAAEGIKNPTNECPGNDIKPFDGNAPALKISGMLSTPSLLLGPHWPWVIAHDRILSMDQIEFFDI